MFTPGHSFGLVALDGLPLDPGVPAELHLDPSRSALRGFPLELEFGCRERLGSLLASRLQRSTLTFIAQEPDMGPGRAAAVREAEALSRALQLVGFIHLETHPIWVGGRTGEDGPTPETTGELRRPRVPPGSPVPPLGWVELGYVLRLREGLRRLDDEAPDGLIQRAVATFTSGTHRARAEERVHEFVRTLEALCAPADGKRWGRRFRGRCELFFGADHDAFLARLYRIKQRAGHARDVLGLYDGLGEASSRRIALWHDAVTAEIVARAVLQRLLLTQDLWAHFRSEGSIEGFWSDAVEEVERSRLWGHPISLRDARTAFRRGVVQPSEQDL
jgi:hypothetical protein